MVFLGAAAFLAGFIDAVVGGGGLVQIPALFNALPHTPIASLLGTNKLSMIWGTAAAASRYARQIKVEWRAALPAAIAAFVFAFFGAFTVSQVSSEILRKALPFILIAVAWYTFKKKDLGSVHAPVRSPRERWWAMIMGAAAGFYDGFFGPGTGSFLIFLFIRFFGFNFLAASAAAKIVNLACNLAALLWFGFSGHVIVALGLYMAVANFSGALIGSHLAIRHGSQFVRIFFLMVVLILIAKTLYDAFF